MIILFLILSFFSEAFATQGEVQNPTPDPTINLDQVNVADQAHDNINNRLQNLANSIDSIFGEKRADDELGRSLMRITESFTVREDKKLKQDTQFRFNLRLPALQSLFNIGAKKKKEKKETTNKLDPHIQNNFNISNPEPKDPWITRFDTGINVGVPPQVFTRFRIRKNWTLNNLIPRFTYEMGWFSKLGFVQNTGMSADRKIRPNLLFRFVNDTDWNLTQTTFRTSHGPSIIQTFRDNCALSYSIRASSVVEEGTWYFNNYFIGPTYRHNLTGNWLFGELTPGLDFPKSLSFKRSPFIMFRFEALFG